MADFPSLWMLRPNEGITPLPTQERILDFTPIMQALATAPQASSTPKEKKGGGSDGEKGWDEMRLGYAQQMYTKQKTLSDQLRALEMTYGPDVAANLPQYQQTEYEYDDATHAHKFAVGKIEKEKVDAYEKGVAAKQAGGQFHLGEWFSGGGLRTHTDHIGKLQTTESKNYDPTSTRAEWSESFDRNPTFYTEEDARKEVDAVMGPAFDAMRSTEDADVFQTAIGDAIGIMTTKKGSGNNFAAMDAAKRQALSKAGFEFKQVPVLDKDGKPKKDKKGNVITEESLSFGGKMFDETSPIVAGYTQSFLQTGVYDGKGNIRDRSTGKLLADDNGFTELGESMLSEYINTDIQKYHEEKRLKNPQTESKSFQEYSPDAYGAGKLRREMEIVDGLSRYQNATGLTGDSGFTFDSLVWAGMTPAERKAMEAPEAGYFTKDGKPTDKYNTWAYQRQLAFDQSIQAVTDEKGNVEVPAMYTVDIGTDGQRYYKPNEAFFANKDKYTAKVGRELMSEVEAIEKEIEGYAPNSPEIKDAERRLKEVGNKMYSYQAVVANGAAQRVIENARATSYEKGVVKSEYVTNAGTYPELDKAISTAYVGQSTDAMPNVVAWDGTSFYSANGIKGGTIREVFGGTVLRDAPGHTNRGVVKDDPYNWNLLKNSPDASKYTAVDGKIYYNGQPYVTTINHVGQIDNQGYQASGANGYRLKSQSEEERQARTANTYYMAAAGNGQAFNESPTITMTPVKGSAPSLESFADLKIDVKAPYQFGEQQLQQEVRNMKKLGSLTVSGPHGGGEQAIVTYLTGAKRVVSIDPEQASKMGLDLKQLAKDIKSYNPQTEDEIYKLAAGQNLKKRGTATSQSVVYTSVPAVTRRVSVDNYGQPKIEDIQLSDLHPDAVKKWQIKPIDRANSDPTKYGADLYTFETQIDVTAPLHRATSDAKNSLYVQKHWEKSFQAAENNGAKIPQTQDEKGNIVPLSQLFNAQNR